MFIAGRKEVTKIKKGEERENYRKMGGHRDPKVEMSWVFAFILTSKVGHQSPYPLSAGRL